MSDNEFLSQSAIDKLNAVCQRSRDIKSNVQMAIDALGTVEKAFKLDPPVIDTDVTVYDSTSETHRLGLMVNTSGDLRAVIGVNSVKISTLATASITRAARLIDALLGAVAGEVPSPPSLTAPRTTVTTKELTRRIAQAIYDHTNYGPPMEEIEEIVLSHLDAAVSDGVIVR